MNYHSANQDIGYQPPSPPGVSGPCHHLKVLVPAVAAGAIIGKGGETIAQLQKDAGARVKMSKASDFYPGTSERVCLISGSVDGILRIHDFIMEKIREKPDPNAKMAIDFDHKQPAEREKQVKVLVPNSTAGMIIGKGGAYIKQIKEESGSYVQISQKSRDHALAERCITIIGEGDGARKATAMVLQKIVEDPQSGSCLNVSYADVTGPVANFNPTGSPYASTGGTSSGQSNVTHSNASYSSNGSLNSLSPTLTNSFNSTAGNAGTAGGMMQFGGVGLGSNVPTANSAQMIESIKTMLRVSGYSEDAVSEISSAMNTLANYGMLGLGLGLGGMFNSMNGPPIIGSMSMASGHSTCHTSLPATNNAMYDPNVQGMAPGGNFGPVGSSSGSLSMSQIGYPPQRQERPPAMIGSSGGASGSDHPFDPIRTNGRSPPLGSPGTASSNNHNYNNNSFGLGIISSPGAGGAGGRKSPSPVDSGEPQTKVEIEIGDNIVGAILGHGGKSLVEIQRLSGANIQISKKGIFVPGTRNRIVTMTGSANAVSTAQYLIEQQIADEETKRQRQNSQSQPVLPAVLR